MLKFTCSYVEQKPEISWVGFIFARNLPDEVIVPNGFLFGQISRKI